MNRIKNIFHDNSTLKEMLTGVLLSNLVILLVAMIFSKSRMASVLGVVIGGLTACFYIIHMAVTIDDALYLDEKGAISQMRKNMLIRYFVVCLIIALVSYFKLADPVTTIFSLLTIKLGAYLQPLIHRFMNRNQTEDPDFAIIEGTGEYADKYSGKSSGK